MSDIVIKVENLSKQYRLGEMGTGTISHDLNRWWHQMRGKEDPYLKIGEENDRSAKGSSEYVWALRDINFEVKQGEVLGIIGKNGAGKSTLLKLLSRVTSPTTGAIKAKGRIASLLEVGTGFHDELTGRENIFLNGAILGMKKSEIRTKLDEIISFSGTERYIDTPVKRYSSGMRVRLAFAVAAHLEPEILIVDEVLAVGDAEFQKKAIGKMKDVSKGEGRTVLFVSHNMVAVKSLCQTGLVLSNGNLVYSSSSEEAVNFYLKSEKLNKSYLSFENFEDAVGNDSIRIKAVKVNPIHGNAGLDYDSGVEVGIEIYSKALGKNLDLTVKIKTIDDVIVFVAGKVLTENRDSKEGIFNCKLKIPHHFLNALTYKLDIVIGENQKYVKLLAEDIISFDIENTKTGRKNNHFVPPGVVRPILNINSEFIKA